MGRRNEGILKSILIEVFLSLSGFFGRVLMVEFGEIHVAQCLEKQNVSQD